MSSEEFGWAYDLSLPPVEKLVLLILANNSFEFVARTPFSNLEQRAGISLEKCRKVLSRLEKRGVVFSITEMSTDHGGLTVELYLKDAPLPPPAPKISKRKVADDGVVYVIRDGAGRCKIGISTNVEKRLISLKTSNAEELVISASFAVKSKNMRAIERAAHQHFREMRIRGEWFAVTDNEAIAFLKTLIVEAAP